MEQQQVVNKIIRDLKMAGLIDPVYTTDVRPFLEQLWVTGWEKGRNDALANHTKKVAQYSRDGKLLNTFGSMRSAAKITGHSYDSIYESILFERITRKGYKWTYVNKLIESYPGPF